MNERDQNCIRKTNCAKKHKKIVCFCCFCCFLCVFLHHIFMLLFAFIVKSLVDWRICSKRVATGTQDAKQEIKHKLQYIRTKRNRSLICIQYNKIINMKKRQKATPTTLPISRLYFVRIHNNRYCY